MPNYPKIYSDNPLSDAKEFDFEAYAKTLTDIILHKENETPITIGIHGEWGSGKTTLMKTIKKKLENSSEDKNTRKCKCMWFNAWKYADEESILTALINRILEQIVTDEKGFDPVEKIKELKEKYKDIKSFNFSILGSGGGIELKNKEHPYYDEFQKTLNDILEEYIIGESNEDGVIDDKEGVLVIFIDDLDRCPPKNVLKVIETIKLFMDQKGCIFVLGTDMKIVSNIVDKAYEETEGFDGKQFMEKVIQLPFNLPPIRDVDVEKFIKSLGLKGMIKEYIEIISKGIKSNPRRIKRFLNLFELQVSLAKNKGILGKDKELDEELLAKWCILEFEFPDFMEEVKRNHELLILMQKTARSKERDKEIEKLDERDKELYKKFSNKRIIAALKHGKKEFTKEKIKHYIYQTQEVVLESKEETKRLTREEIVKKVTEGESLAAMDFSGANLRAATLSGADMSWADLSRADMSWADLSGVDLHGANLSWADLSGANLRVADLRGADLYRADLHAANLHKANLHKADSRGADFTNAIIDIGTTNLENTNWQEAIWDEETREKLEQKYRKK